MIERVVAVKFNSFKPGALVDKNYKLILQARNVPQYILIPRVSRM